MDKPKDNISYIFERFNKLINDLQLHDKYYKAEEVNLKFLLTQPDHLEQKISAIREGRDLSRMILEVLYGILKTYEPEMIQRKSLRAGQGHIVDGSSTLMVNDVQSSDNEQEIQTPVVSSNEQKNKEPHRQLILELEEDEFYTLDELDELDQFMAYLARKFSNIIVKKPKFLKNKGQTSNKDSRWKGKAQYNSGGKSGYKTGFVDMSKIRCFNCDEVGHFSTECRKPKSQYNETVEKMSMEMFHIHTSLVATTEELVEHETVKQENEYLKNKLKCAIEIEVVLREKLEKNKVKLKSFRNASQLVGQYHEKNKPCARIAIGLNYDALNNKRKVEGDKGKETVSEDVPAVLRKVGSHMFKVCEVNFSEEELIRKQEIVDEDNEKKCTEITPTSKAEKKPMVD
ncbi:hypothetical protein AgCh_009008 [Apium graveolens]